MRIPSDNDSQLQQSCLGIQKESIGSPSPLQKRPMANEPIGEAPSMEHKRSQIAARPEEGGLPSSQRQTGSRGFWSRWGFRIKLMVALLLPILIEVRVSSHFECRAGFNFFVPSRLSTTPWWPVHNLKLHHRFIIWICRCALLSTCSNKLH